MYVYHTVFNNNKEYIGASTKEPNETQNYYGSHPKLKEDVRHNDVKLVKKVIIAETQDVDYLSKCELTVLKKMKVVEDPSFYNESANSSFAFFGKNHTEESKQKISDSTNNIGENNPMFGKAHSEETKQKISDNHADFSGDNHPSWGMKRSDESKSKMSKAMKDSWAKRRAA